MERDINSSLSLDQVRQLTAELVPGVTYKLAHKGNADYLRASYIHVRLNQIFGFEGWCQEVLKVTAIPHAGSGFAFVAKVRLTIRMGDSHLTREDVGVGEDTKLDTAYKGAVSDAIKRAARTLGAQFAVLPPEEAKVRTSERFWGACKRAAQAVLDRANKERGG